MIRKYLFIYLIICLLVVGCATLKESDGENQTLVVASFTGEPGLILYLQEISGNETYLLQFGSNGLFNSVKIPPGSYSVSKYAIKYKGSGMIYFTGTIRTLRIEIVYGKVNNLGTIDVIHKMNEVAGGSNALALNSNYEYTKNLFSRKYGSSNWNQSDWINIKFDEPDSPGNIPPATPIDQPSQSTQVPDTST